MLKLFGHAGPSSGKLMLPIWGQFALKCVTTGPSLMFLIGTAIANQKSGTTRRLTMRKHIFTAMMALIFTACASHHRSVASVKKAEQDYQVQERGVDAGMAGRDFAGAASK